MERGHTFAAGDRLARINEFKRNLITPSQDESWEGEITKLEIEVFE